MAVLIENVNNRRSERHSIGGKQGRGAYLLERSKVHHREKSSGFPANQDQFIWNPYIEFIREQTGVNAQLIATVNQLEERCGKILDVT